jgi:hypothetical protein
MKLIYYIHQLIFYVADKTHTSVQRRAEVDLAVWDSSNDLFNDLQPQYGLNSAITEALSVFEDDKTYVSAELNDGKLTKPENYFRYTEIGAVDGKEVEVIKANAWNKKLSDPIAPPTADYPAVRIGNNEFEVSPEDTLLKVWYLKSPQKPEYAVDGQGVYDDDASTDVEWNSAYFYILVNKALSKLGINLRSEQIVNYANQMEVFNKQ